MLVILEFVKLRSNSVFINEKDFHMLFESFFCVYLLE